MTRVLIAAASAVVRAGLESLIAAHADLTVVGSASDVTALVGQIEELEPDVVVLDLDSETEETINALPSFGRETPAPAFVVLADDAHGSWVVEALRAGVRGVLPRGTSADGITAAVEAARAGLLVLHPDAVDLLQSESTAIAHDVAASTTGVLTPREIEVLGMMAEGLGNKTIAHRLDISEHTVKFHVASIMSKLDASSRTEAVTVGIRRGLIML